MHSAELEADVVGWVVEEDVVSNVEKVGVNIRFLAWRECGCDCGGGGSR